MAHSSKVYSGEEREGFMLCSLDDTIVPGEIAVECNVIPDEPLAFLALPGMVDPSTGYVKVRIRERDEHYDEVVVPFPGYDQEFGFVLSKEQVADIIVTTR